MKELNIESVSQNLDYETEGGGFLTRLSKSVKSTLHYATTAILLSNMMPVETTASDSKETNPDQFTALVESVLKNNCVLKVESQNEKMIFHILQAHAIEHDETRGIEWTASIQKKIEEAILKLQQIAQDSDKKIHYFSEGSIEDKNTMIMFCENVDRIMPSLFSKGIEYAKKYELNLMDTVRRSFLTGNSIETSYLEALKYAYWIRISNALNDSGLVLKESKENWRTVIDEELLKVDMNKVYYSGAINKLLCEGRIAVDAHRKTEDKALLDRDSESIYRMNLSPDESERICEEREDWVISNIIEEMEPDSDIAILVYGAGHDFENNILSAQENEKTPGLLNIEVITDKDWEDLHKKSPLKK